jgi:hypothetical protein
MIENIKWVVRWEHFEDKEWTFVPYAKEGMSCCIIQGFPKGKVFVNDLEVEPDTESLSGWKYKEEEEE